MAESDSDGKVVVSGYVRETTKGALLDEVARRAAVLRSALGDAAPKVSMASVVGEVLERWRTANQSNRAEREANTEVATNGHAPDPPRDL